MRKEQLNNNAIFVIDNFLSADECADSIAQSEAKGYGDAPITTMGGPVMAKEIRNNERLMVDDPALAVMLFERAKPLLVPEWFGWELLAFNETFRYYRYDQGQRFAPHFDGYFERNDQERSQFTFMIYLNEGFEGGETVFGRPGQSLAVKPECGKALVFYHRQLHEGTAVVSGRKYVLRTDIMYRRTSRAVE